MSLFSVAIVSWGCHGCDRKVVGFTTTFAISAYHQIKVCQWLVTGLWFSLCTLISSTSKTDCHDIIEILLKVALNTQTPHTILEDRKFVKIMNWDPSKQWTKDHKICICCFSSKHVVWRSKTQTSWLGIWIMCRSGW